VVTVAHACLKRRLKWVLSTWEYNWASQSPGNINVETWPAGWGLGVGLTTPHQMSLRKGAYCEGG